ncbi:hypothetical protein DFJ73DRAFT_873198 [Zopfochytrium polystomum]|nr:hypothetical protein DFJ73DRAFT_873198 [Zopfochytrium polystomum]
MVWITDRTPHESVPLPSTPAADGSSGSTFRQYFRLVTSDCAVWYARHSTRNETGVEPPKCVKVIGEDKFAAAGVGGDDGAKKQMKKKDKDKAGGSAGEGSGPRMTNRAMPSSDYLTRTWAEKKKEYQARLASANPGLPPKKT